MDFFGENAQVSAPFELFVAVIVMGFVVVMGAVVLAQVGKEICLNSVDKEMTEFKDALESTVKGGSRELSFSPDSSCFDSKETIMKIEVYEGKICSERCGNMASQCFVMIFSNPNLSNAVRQKCIDVPVYSSFLTEESCSDPELANLAYTTINPLSDNQFSIKSGKYVIRSASPQGDQYKKFCVWYKAM